MKVICLVIFIFFTSILSVASQKAKIIGEVVEIYSDADFDSEVIDEVYQNQIFTISDKQYGAFYRIKLKSGKVGYIVDYELNIEGKGPLKPRDIDQLELQEAIDSLKSGPPQLDKESEEEENEVFGNSLAGLTLQMFNYHEDTMGAEQVADLLALGYKSLSTFAWSVAGTWQVPNYYTASAGRSGKGFKMWGDVGFSYNVGQFPAANLRLGGNAFTHISAIKIETATRSYDLQDITMGVNFDLAFTKKFKSIATDFSIKYYFDKSRYAAVGLAILF